MSLSISLSLSLFLIVEKLRKGIEDGFTNSISNADLIVGSRAGPLQLLLYTVFHLGSPTNNISMDSYKKIKDLELDTLLTHVLLNKKILSLILVPPAQSFVALDTSFKATSISLFLS